LWIDPGDIVSGRLTELRLPRTARAQSRPLQPMGAIVYSYLALKLRLSAAGFDVVLHDYDWRGDVMAQGQALAARLAADDADKLALIGHSMGALLARAALAHYRQGAGAERISRVIGLGAPHGGSIAAVQALRGSYPIVGRLAAIDRRHDAQGLTRLAFRGFLSLYQLLPAPGAALDLFDADSWPASGARPDLRLLRAARGFAGQLATADERFVSIVGTGQRTVTGIERRGSSFATGSARPVTAPWRAPAPRCPVRAAIACAATTGELPRNEQVAAALIDLLRQGSTRRLRAGVTGRHGRSSYVTDAALRRELGRKIDWYRLSIGERRQYLNRLNDPPRCYRARSESLLKKL
jgi:pimeloyl-ACP methyl ester carboxylesterase